MMTMAVSRTPTRKAIRTKMTNSVVVKEPEQPVERVVSTTGPGESVIFPRSWS